MKKKNVGIKVNEPKEACDDANCPFHGNLVVKGKKFTGVVVKSKAAKTAVVEWTRTKFVSKYERYEKARTKVQVHNPPCINAEAGEVVNIMECRPLSKTKTMVIVEKMGKDIEYQLTAERIKESKEEEKSKKAEKTESNKVVEQVEREKVEDASN